MIEYSCRAIGIDEYIAPSHWGNRAGIVGALTLAQQALNGSSNSSNSKSITIHKYAFAAVALASLAIGVAVGKLRH